MSDGGPLPDTAPADIVPPFLAHLRASGRDAEADAAPIAAGAAASGSATANVEDCLAAIDRLDADLRAFVLVLDETARERAASLDAARARGDPTGPLHGVTVAVKDCIDVAGVPTTCGTAGGRDRPVPGRTAACVAALEQAGAVVIGKTNLHEWAFGATSDNPTFGRVRNPHDRDRSPGGSSGGSAVAVATGMAMLALGTDTGGSVRLPAAYCGVAGLKVTPGRISVAGVEPLSWTLDTVGLLAARVTDLVTPYRLLAATGSLTAAPTGRATLPPSLAVETTFFAAAGRTDPAVTAAVDRAIGALTDAGAPVERVAIPELAGVRDDFFRIVLAEGAAVHSGRRRTQRRSYAPDIRAALDEGDDVRAVDYVNALRARPDVHTALSEVLQHNDVILAPVAPILSALHDTTSVTWPDGSIEPALEAAARLCLPASFAGLPAVAVIGGWAGALPVGLQLVGAAGDEEHLLAVAAWVEAALTAEGTTVTAGRGPVDQLPSNR